MHAVEVVHKVMALSVAVLRVDVDLLDLQNAL